MFDRSRLAYRSFVSICIAALTLCAFSLPVRAAPDGGIVGNGTPASCDDTAFTNALAGGGNITFNCGGAATITLTAVKQIASDTVIDGNNLITLLGNNGVYIQVFVDKTLTLRNIRLANFKTNSSGAIENFGTLTLENATMIGHQATVNGGAIHNFGTVNANRSAFINNRATAGGAIYNDGGTVNVDGSTFDGNRTGAGTGTGGGISNGGGKLVVQSALFTKNFGFDGGAIFVGSGSTADIRGTTILSNSAAYGGGIESSGTLTVSNSAINRNSATNIGGAIWLLDGKAYIRGTTINANKAFEGAGIYNMSNVAGVVVLRDVTVSNNTAGGDGGGIYDTGEIYLIDVTLSGNSVGSGKGGGGLFLKTNGKAVLSWVTAANNNAFFGQGIYGEGGPNASRSLFIYRSLLANNGSDCAGGNITSIGYNVSGDTTCGAFTNTGDVKSANVSLGPLAYNGGLTLTHLPLTGNAAINRVPNGVTCNMPDGSTPADQRGASRPINTNCDSGAVEIGATLPMVRMPIVVRPLE